MSSLKVTMAAASSIHSNPYKLWVRTLATTPSSSPITASTTTTTNSNSLTLFSIHKGKSAGWRITPCAPSAHRRINPIVANLGFRGLYHHHKSFSSFNNTPRSVSERKGGGDQTSSFVAENMGSEHHKDDLSDERYHIQKSPFSSPQQLGQQQSTKLLTLPTILTLGRVAAVPLLVCTFYVNSRWGTTATTSIFIAAAITDWLDGYIARKMRLGTAFGAFLDPVADKLMVAATLVLLCTRPPNVDMFGEAPWLLTVPSIAIIGREITMSAVREWAATQNSKLLEAVAVNNLGKWKTASQMTALTILLVTRDSSLAGPGVLVASGVVLLYISAGLAVWSLVVYMRKIWKVLLK